jgi:hypothetical protein
MNFDPLFQLSSHFTLGEMSRTDNRVLLEKNHAEALWYLDNLQKLCVMVLEPVRSLLGIPVRITSGFRCKELNTSIGGSPTSQHCHGEAADTVYEGHDLKEIFNAIAFSDIPYSQIIYEFGSWVHLGLQDEVLYPGKVKQMLVAYSANGKTVYEGVNKPL